MTNDLTTRLKKRAQVWATEITKTANQYLGKYSSLISVQSKTTAQDGLIGIESIATAKNPDKPVARAYEYGSGIHSRLKARSRHQLPDGRILIRPKAGKLLAFNWEIANANPDKFMFSKDGRVLLPEVKHPGVRAANGGRGYLSPAIAKVRAKMRAEIPKELRASVIDQFRKKFK